MIVKRQRGVNQLVTSELCHRLCHGHEPSNDIRVRRIVDKRRRGQCGVSRQVKSEGNRQLVTTPISPLIHAAIAGCKGLVGA